VQRKLSLSLAGWLVMSAGTAGGALAPAWAQSDAFEQSKAVQEKINDSGQATQDKIDQLSEKAREMLAEYRSAQDQAASIEQYNQQLASLVKSQEQEIASVQKQLAEIDTTQQEFVPLMLRMVETLDQFVQRDVPFLAEEREQRVRELKSLMDRADVTTAEKFRQVMNAYQTEMEYGRTIEGYRAELSLDGENRTVRLLRIGRVALLYQTLDGQKTGRWDPATQSWQELEGGYRSAVEKGLRIAAEQAPPDLLRVPVEAPEEQ